MNIKTMLTACVLMLSGHLHAQYIDTENPKPAVQTPVEKNFRMRDDWVNIRDYIYLPNQTKVTVELTHVAQYHQIKHIDTILSALWRDIAFYKDSILNNPGSIRVDYAIDDILRIRKIRFSKKAPDGDIFMNKDGNTSRLKIEYDTICIYVRQRSQIDTMIDPRQIYKRMQSLHNTANFYQVTFRLNNIQDIIKVVNDTDPLLHAIDTMMKTKREGTLKNPFKYPSSARYNPYATIDDVEKRHRYASDVRFKQYSALVKSDDLQNWSGIRRSDILTLDANFGAGLVRNYMAPYSEIGFTLTHRHPRYYGEKFQGFQYRLSTSAYFLFEKNADGKYSTQDNWFVNFAIGERNEPSFGVGYLFRQSGNYFTGTTLKAFLDIRLLKKSLTLSPELIVTDNLKKAFPGITLKVL